MNRLPGDILNSQCDPRIGMLQSAMECDAEVNVGLSVRVSCSGVKPTIAALIYLIAI